MAKQRVLRRLAVDAYRLSLTTLFAFLLLDHWMLPSWLQPAPGFELQPIG